MKFEEINSINVNNKVEKRKSGGIELSYLSWSYAVAEMTKLFPDWKYEVKMFDGKPYCYDENTGYMVFTSITADGRTLDMWLPVMDSTNKAMLNEPYTYKTKYDERTVAKASMFDINKTIMRCLVKNMAMFGLGLYIYAGEDLPEQDDSFKKEVVAQKTKDTKAKNAELKEARNTPEQLKDRWNSAMAYVRKLNEVTIKNESLMKQVNDLVDCLENAGLLSEKEELVSLINSKINLDDNDLIPY